MQRKKNLILVFLVLPVIACGEDPIFPDEVDLISVYGVLNANRSRQEVYLSRVFILEEERRNGGLEQFETPISDAEVMIEGQEVSEILTDRGDGRYDGRIIVKPGKRYFLSVRTPDGLFVTAETTVPMEPALSEQLRIDSLEVIFDYSEFQSTGQIRILNQPKWFEWSTAGAGCTYQFSLCASNGFPLAGFSEPDLEQTRFLLFDPGLSENRLWYWNWFPGEDHPPEFFGQLRVTAFDPAITAYEYYDNFQRVADSNIEGGIGYFGSVITYVESVIFVEKIIE